MSEPFFTMPCAALQSLDALSVNALKLYLHLRASLNRKTGQCNPTPESLGWEKTKYYRARKELELLKLVSFEGMNARFLESEKLHFLQLSNSPILQFSNSPTEHTKVGENATPSYKEPEEFNQRGKDKEPEEKKAAPSSPFGHPASLQAEQAEKAAMVIAGEMGVSLNANASKLHAAAMVLLGKYSLAEVRSVMQKFLVAYPKTNPGFLEGDLAAFLRTQKTSQAPIAKPKVQHVIDRNCMECEAFRKHTGLRDEASQACREHFIRERVAA